MCRGTSGRGLCGNLASSLAYRAQLSSFWSRDTIIHAKLWPASADRISMSNVWHDQSLGPGSTGKFCRSFPSQHCRGNSGSRMWIGGPWRAGHSHRGQRFSWPIRQTANIIAQARTMVLCAAGSGLVGLGVEWALGLRDTTAMKLRRTRRGVWNFGCCLEAKSIGCRGREKNFGSVLEKL